MMVAMVINPLSCSAQPVIDPNTIVEFINGVRTSVTAASNIRQLVSCANVSYKLVNVFSMRSLIKPSKRHNNIMMQSI